MKHIAYFTSGVLVALAVPALAQVTSVGSFSDVSVQSFYADAVEKFARRGIVRGYEDGRFGPDDPLTRAQVAVLFDRYDSQNVEPLRRQITKLRNELGLGRCGDGTVQEGEQCDDGNASYGDGCTPDCVRESGKECPDGRVPGQRIPASDGCNTCTVQPDCSLACTEMACLPPKSKLCEGKYRPGESYVAEDGCNKCVCGENGIARCTKMACPEPSPKKDWCFSSTDCHSGEVCTTELGECGSYHCSGEVCTDVCSGRCKIASDETAECGNGVCERSEGNGCPEDCRGDEESTCNIQREKLEGMYGAYKSCDEDSDCKLFEQSCPYITCGEAVNELGYDDVKRQAQHVLDACDEEGRPVACAACVFSRAVCRNSVCVLEQDAP